MRDSSSDPKDSVTEVAEESFVRARPVDIERGTVLAGRYQVEDVIGKGGSGIVLRVFDRLAQNVVALKVLKAELAHDGKWERRFSRELRLGRPIQHPNVCRIFDIGDADGHRFLTMELARGGSLRDELRRIPALSRSIEERINDAQGVTRGLAALHEGGITHRDFKPDNILRMEDGRLVLSDFGLATDAANVAGATVLIGTPHYMAPEVLAGDPATGRSDVWALGVVLHEIFFGQRPERRSTSFEGKSREALRPGSSIERRMLALCERCLAESPLDRPTDAREVAKLFDSTTLSRPSGPLSSRKTVRAALYGATAIALVTVIWLASRANRHNTSGTPSLRGSAVVQLEAQGEPADWSSSARIATEVSGEVHCFSVRDAKTAFIVWGVPRRAEEVDLASGRRRSSQLAPETFRIGCPEFSPNGKALLYTAQSQAGAPEIRLSQDGRSPTTVTSGSDPRWLGGNEEFLYDVDSSHAGVFSLPTMSFTLLGDATFGRRHMILSNAASRNGEVVALLLGNDSSEYGIAVYDARPFETARVFSIPVKYQIQFEPETDAVLVSHHTADGTSVLAELDWRADKLWNVGKYSGFDLAWAAFPGDRAGDKVLVARHSSSDVWLIGRDRRERLTNDGEDYSADVSPTGDLLVSRRGHDGRLAIWWKGHDGREKKLTSGPRDVGPAFSRDGRFWTYSDYATRTVMLCSTATEECRVVHQDEFLPVWPKLSPDGTSIAYVTQLNASKVIVISASDGRLRNSWDGFWQCSPVWSSSTTLLYLEAANGEYFWSERKVSTGEKTGRRIPAPAENMALGEIQCGSASPESPLFQSMRIEKEERSRILVLK
jgi:serine/threonine protein kinase